MHTPVIQREDTEPKVMDQSEIVKRIQSINGKAEACRTDIKEIFKRLSALEARQVKTTEAVGVEVN